MKNTQTPATFCIWLQGFLDGAGDSLDANQLATLRAKLDTVFTHSEADTATESPFCLPDEFIKMREEYEKQKADKWVYDGPPVPQTWPTFKPLPYYPPSHWPPSINC
jgi:hypothetical protein